MGPEGEGVSQGAPSTNEIFVHVDENSIGLYTFPLYLVDVDSDPIGHPGAYRFGDLSSDGILSYSAGGFAPTNPRQRPIPKTAAGAAPVHATQATSPVLALPLFLDAVRGYWLCRFRMSKATKDLVVTGAAQIDLRRILEDRNTDRNDIINHAISLQRKLMAIQYHRDRFLEGLQACAATPDCVLFHQVQMEAEFVAHDAMTYSFLEELSALISKLHWIRTGKNLPKSFNDLLGFPGVPAGFEDIFKTAKWFPEFHARRTNSTHSFGPVITFDATQNDLSIYHNQERRFAALPGELSAKAQFECLVTGFDDMTRALCVLMLKWFHPYDILAFQALVPGGASGPEETRVWTRGVEFDATLTQGSEGMALLDAEGRSHFKVPLGRAGADPQSASEGVAGAAPANKPIEPTAAPCD